MVAELLKANREAKILVCAPSNVAIDNVVLALLRYGMSLKKTALQSSKAQPFLMVWRERLRVDTVRRAPL